METKVGATRRSFIASSAVLSAGGILGASGIPVNRKAVREHGPVRLWAKMPVIFKEPVSVDGELFADDHRGMFGIRIFKHGLQREKTTIIEASLTDVHAVVISGSSKTVCLCFDQDQPPIRMPAAIIAEDGKVTFLIDCGKNDIVPLWMDRAELLRVL